MAFKLAQWDLRDDVGLLIYNPLVDLQEEMRARVCVSEKGGEHEKDE